MAENSLTTIQKAFAFNLDHNKYGTIAEIGAGQEVSRAFFRAGGASGTIAKTISAYDMLFSDAIYGEEKNKRYVTENRVKKMLDKVMQDHGLSLVDPLGEPFDPEFHEAMTMLPSEEYAANTVMEVLQKGFQLHDRLLRPAMVVVSQGSEND